MKVDTGAKLQAVVNRLAAQAGDVAASLATAASTLATAVSDLASLTASVTDGAWFQVNALSGSGWSAFSGGAKPAVKLLGRPQNSVLFVGAMNVGTITGGQQILNVLPSAYRPQNAPIRVPVGAFGSTAAIDNSSYIVVNVDGSVTVGSVNGPPTAVGWCCLYPLQLANRAMSRAQLCSLNPDGSDPRWLGELGNVAGLTYSSTFSGGCDQLSCTLVVPPNTRSEAINCGRILQAYLAGSRIWDGKLDEPQPQAGGFAITAHGSGTFGSDFLAIFTSWTPQDVVSEAISRGMRWRIHGGAIPSTGLFLSQPQDPASLTVADALTQFATLGAQAWTVDRRDGAVSFVPLPSAPDRFLVASSPPARTVTADVNAVAIRYTATDDGNGSQTFGEVWATDDASIAIHDRMESYLDLTDAGVMTSAEAAGAGNLLLAHYQRANFAGPFTVMPGQVLTLGGAPVDLAAEHAGHVYRLLVSDGGYGGEVVPGAIDIICGSYEYDDSAEIATITPYQSISDDLQGLMSSLVASITPR